MTSSQATISQPFDAMRAEFATKQRGLWSQAFQRLRHNRLAFGAGLLLALIMAICVLGSNWSVVQRHPPSQQVYTTASGEDNTDASPSADHWLGTDSLGRDLWARTIQGTVYSLKIGFGAEFIVVCIGITLGMLAALGGKVTDTAVTWVTDLAYAFPDLLAIILFRQVLINRDWPIIGSGDPQIPGFEPTLLVTIFAISFVSWVTVCRLVRGQMLSIKEQDYVTAARSLGASQWRIVRAHMLPNTLSTVIVAITFGIPTRIFAEASLSFIGLGVVPPASSLGSLIVDGYQRLQSNEMLVVWPAIMVATLMLCFTFLGDGLRDALDPRTRK
jgi:oligopeptide transport system permease protein